MTELLTDSHIYGTEDDNHALLYSSLSSEDQILVLLTADILGPSIAEIPQHLWDQIVSRMGGHIPLK
jgi:hypothetical protein